MRSSRPQRLRLLAGLVLVVLALVPDLSAPAQEDAGDVYLVEVTGTIDLGLAPYLQRVLDQAAEEGAPVLIRIDTPGGRLDAVFEMRSALLDTAARTIAFVDPNALSAGALVAIASEEIVVSPGAVMGAATPVTGSGETADEKTISAVAAVFRSTAETRGRDPEVAEAMVDPAVEIEGLVEEGELLTLSDSEAVETGYADAVASTVDEALAAVGLEGATVIPTEPTPAEGVVRWLTNPVVSSLLLTVGIWLLVGDLLSGGIGVVALIGVGLIGLFFWGHLLAGLAGWEDVLLIIVGLGLILAEILVIPGTGIAGVLGLAAFLGGAFLAMIDRDLATGEQVQRAVGTITATLVLVLAGAVLAFFYLARGGGPRGLVLQDHVGATPPEERRGWLRWMGDEDTSDTEEGGEPEIGERGEGPSMVGIRGVAITDLRPGGIADLDGQRVDVVTEGDLLRAGTEVEVVADHGYRRVVRPVPQDG